MRNLAILILTLCLWLLPFAGRSLGANMAALSVTATVLSKSQCKFNSSAATLNFGTLDPTNPVAATATTTLPIVCHGSAPNATFQITDNDGLYATGPDARRMRNQNVTTAFIPYQLSYAPASGTVPKGSVQTLTITGTIQGTGYQTAVAGTYSDTVVLTIAP